jgi:hypothetical protein
LIAWPFQVAVMVAVVVVVVVTCLVVTTNVMFGAVTLVGTDTAGESLTRSITLPLGATPLNSMLPVGVAPPEKMFSTGGPAPMKSCMMLGGSTVSGLVTVLAPRVADSVTLVDLVTCLGSMEKVAVAVEAATLMVAGTEATVGSVLESETTVPPAGAGTLSCTVPKAASSGVPPLKTWVWLRMNVPPPP